MRYKIKYQFRDGSKLERFTSSTPPRDEHDLKVWACHLRECAIIDCESITKLEIEKNYEN